MIKSLGKSFTVIARLIALIAIVISITISSISVAKADSIRVGDTGQSGSVSGNRTYTYWYEYNAKSKNIELYVKRNGDGKVTNCFDYAKKYGYIPSSNAIYASGTESVSGIRIKNVSTMYKDYKASDIAKALKSYGNKNWDLRGGKIPFEDGKPLVYISLVKMIDTTIKIEVDPDPEPEEKPEPPPVSNTYYQEKISVVDRAFSLHVWRNGWEYPTTGGTVPHTFNSYTKFSTYITNNIGSPQSAFSSVPDIDFAEQNPTIYKTDITSRARYVKVYEKICYRRHDIYGSYTDPKGGVHWYWAGYSPWEEYTRLYYFGSGKKIINDQSKTFNVNVKSPEMKEASPLDLTSEEHVNDLDLYVEDPGTSKIRNTLEDSATALKNSIVDKSGIAKGEEFALTSENIAKDFTVQNEGWLGITDNFAWNFTLGVDTGAVGSQYLDSVTLHYGPYTGNNDAVKKNSIEAIVGGTSYGEQKGPASITVSNAEQAKKASKITFKERSIKYGRYTLGSSGYNNFYLVATVHRNNVEGVDYKVKVKGNYIDNDLRITNSKYNYFEIEADFLQPYLYGTFNVKDVAGSE